MKIAPLNSNNARHGVNFEGKTPDINDLIAIKKIANISLDGLEESLINSIEKKTPGLLQAIGEEKYIPDDTVTRKISSALKSFFGMPLDAIDFIAKKFPNSSLNNAEFLQKYRASVQAEDEIRALQGIHNNTLRYIRCVTRHPDSGNYEEISNTVAKNFNEKLNKAMADDAASYDTKKERFAARIISGFTAALFLGSDFYNKAIQKGKSKEEAEKEQHLKQGQEIKENLCEAITQFAVFACFSKAVNKSVWAPAIIGTCIGLVSRVISRATSGMPIFRIKTPENNNSTTVSINEFIKSVKKENAQDDTQNKKKPVLSFKNILAFCALSIAGGYALRFGKNHTKIGKSIAEILQKHTDKFNAETIEEKCATPDKLKKLSEILLNSGNSKLSDCINDINIKDNINKTGNIVLGTDFKTKKLFGKIEVKTKDLKALKFAPFKFIKELVSYPYKIAVKLEEAIKNSKMKAKGITPPKKLELTEDIYGIKNLYKRFLEFEEKYGGDEAKLTEEFGNYVRKMRLASNNEVTSSKGNNSKIAVIAQTLGTLTGMWFNMNDEFNSSVRNGSTKEEAEKDARLRGINKFFRMTVQIIISGTLNDMFAKQYNNSIAKSGAIVAASTVLTDMASRVLSGMPSKKMTKEELEKYQKDHKEGSMAWYYKMIDKLAS